jgi:hypothetical protein
VKISTKIFVAYEKFVVFTKICHPERSRAKSKANGATQSKDPYPNHKGRVAPALWVFPKNSPRPGGEFFLDITKISPKPHPLQVQ